MTSSIEPNTCEETIEYGGAELATSQFFDKVLEVFNRCPETKTHVLKINSKYAKHRKLNFDKTFQTKVT